MSEGLRIGIIDSGHGPGQRPLIGAARRFWLEGEHLREGEANPDKLHHGSTVLDTIAALAGHVECCMAQVFDERHATSALQIAAAIYWLMEERVKVINLSLGLRVDRPLLREACGAALDHGILLCASNPARGQPVYPASYEGVLRATGDARCRHGQWSWLDSEQADFGSSAASVHGVLFGASAASAAMTGHAAAYLASNPHASVAQVWQYLRAGASYVGVETRRRMS